MLFALLRDDRRALEGMRFVPEFTARDEALRLYAEMIERIRARLHLTSLQFQKLDDLVDAIGLPKKKLCTYCWDGCEGCK